MTLQNYAITKAFVGASNALLLIKMLGQHLAHLFFALQSGATFAIVYIVCTLHSTWSVLCNAPNPM